MKKILGTIFAALIALAAGCSIIYCMINARKDKALRAENTTVESLIQQDWKYFDNMAGRIVLYESRVVMPKAFNESDKFVAQEVTNVFQQTVDTKTGFETTVYLITHQINDCNTDIDVHKGAFVLDDKAIDMDSVKVSFDKAFKLARQSNYAPSKSRYITLRHGVGSIDKGVCYWIGNDNYGHLWVDAETGEVSDK